MRIRKFPHACSIRLLAGFDCFNGLGEDYLRVHEDNTEVDFFLHLITDINNSGNLGLDTPIPDPKGENLRVTEWTLAIPPSAKLYTATLRVQQTRGINFLEKLGLHKNPQIDNLVTFQISGKDLKKKLEKLKPFLVNPETERLDNRKLIADFFAGKKLGKYKPPSNPKQEVQ